MFIRKLLSSQELAICAKMMITTKPWSALYFTFEQCMADLSNHALEVYGAISPNGEILGFLASMEYGIGFEPMIEYLCVNEKSRSAGVGSSLIKFFEQELFPNVDNLYIFVSDINPDAKRLYEKQGYKLVGTLPHYNLIDQTEFLLRKSRRPRQTLQMQKQEK